MSVTESRPTVWTRQRVRSRVLDLEAEGLGVVTIMQTMRDSGIPCPPSLDERWSMAAVRILLGRPTLADLGIHLRGEQDADATPADVAAAVERVRHDRQPAQFTDRPYGGPVRPLVDRVVVDALWDWPCLPMIGQSAFCPLCRQGHPVRSLGITAWSSRHGGPCHHADAPPLVTLLPPDEWEWGQVFRDDEHGTSEPRTGRTRNGCDDG